MTNNFYNEQDLIEADEIYKPYKVRVTKNIIVEIIIELANGNGYLFPYAYKTISEYSKKTNNDGSIQYAFSLIGGGKSLLLQFNHFSIDEFNKFLELMSEHKISNIYEFSGDINDTNEPIISVIEEI